MKSVFTNERFGTNLQYWASFAFTTFLIQVLMLLLWPVFRVRVYGRRNTRLNCLYVSNHFTMIDPWIISYALVPTFNPRSLPWQTPERNNYVNNWVMAALSWLSRCIPIERSGTPESKLWSITTIASRIKRGESALVFIEGTRSRTGRLRKYVSGVGRVIYNTNCEVVPIIMKGADKFLPIGSKFPRFWHRLEIHIGEPFKINVEGSEQVSFRYYDVSRQAFQVLQQLETKVLGPPNDSQGPTASIPEISH